MVVVVAVVVVVVVLLLVPSFDPGVLGLWFGHMKSQMDKKSFTFSKRACTYIILQHTHTLANQISKCTSIKNKQHNE